ncbi:hypothetical protein HYU11_06145 [Candidatus Woesearchaeota archaeon]|nr:hypothetical protein [Candidatus Woesearchaeota archaeon]
MDSGWKPLPLSLKVILVLLAIGLGVAIFSLPAYVSDPLPAYILGQKLSGEFSIVVQVFSLSFSALLVLAIWRRWDWGWKLGLSYYGFSILNTLLAFPYIDEMSSFAVENSGTQFSLLFFQLTFAFSILISALLAAVFYWKRDYFMKPRNAFK